MIKPWEIPHGFMSSAREWHTVVSGFMFSFIVLVHLWFLSVWSASLMFVSVVVIHKIDEYQEEPHYLIFGFFCVHFIYAGYKIILVML